MGKRLLIFMPMLFCFGLVSSADENSFQLKDDIFYDDAYDDTVDENFRSWTSCINHEPNLGMKESLESLKSDPEVKRFFNKEFVDLTIKITNWYVVELRPYGDIIRFWDLTIDGCLISENYEHELQALLAFENGKTVRGLYDFEKMVWKFKNNSSNNKLLGYEVVSMLAEGEKNCPLFGTLKVIWDRKTIEEKLDKMSLHDVVRLDNDLRGNQQDIDTYGFVCTKVDCEDSYLLHEFIAKDLFKKNFKQIHVDNVV